MGQAILAAPLFQFSKVRLLTRTVLCGVSSTQPAPDATPGPSILHACFKRRKFADFTQQDPNEISVCKEKGMD